MEVGWRCTRTSPSGGGPKPRLPISPGTISSRACPTESCSANISSRPSRICSKVNHSRFCASTSIKQVNDTLGHPIGDRLLQAVATRLTAFVTESDQVARIGGDEFAIVQRAVERPEKSSLLATRIVDAISAPFDIEGKHVVIGTSIGVALAPADGRDPDQLLKNADMALYLAKTDG